MLVVRAARVRVPGRIRICGPPLLQDFHQGNPNKLVSAGMDACIKIWDLESAGPRPLTVCYSSC